jgi:hypothetical protein
VAQTQGIDLGRVREVVDRLNTRYRFPHTLHFWDELGNLLAIQ